MLELLKISTLDGTPMPRLAGERRGTSGDPVHLSIQVVS